MPDFVESVNAHATDLNTLLKIFGVGSSSIGSAPSPTTMAGFKVQTGTVVVTAATGGYQVTFPTAFPSGVVMVLLSFGDDPSAVVTPFVGNLTTSGFKIYLRNSGGIINGGLYRLSWLAIGW